ncbi:MAG: hypothetical protein JNL98_06935 [Bryobacterales bacterium]|nr:hypothetical protein [Bryobacterales bacterium]
MIELPFAINNYPPTVDGERLRYSYESGVFSVVPDGRWMIFVNGMRYDAATFRDHCMGLSFLTRANVIGVFNLGESEWRDLEQAIGDYWAILGAAKTEHPKKVAAIKLFAAKLVEDLKIDVASISPFLAKIVADTLPKANFVNPAVTSLYNLIQDYGDYWGASPMCLLCHSQGALITSRALYMLEATRKGNLNLPSLHVFSCGSEAPFWPTSISHSDYVHTNDPLTKLSMGALVYASEKCATEYPDPSANKTFWTDLREAISDPAKKIEDAFLFAHWIDTYVGDFVNPLRNAIWSGSPPSTYEQVLELKQLFHKN